MLAVRGRTVVYVALVAFAPTAVQAHSGGTDQNGCHVDSSTGTRHCHGAGTGGSTVGRSGPSNDSAAGWALLGLGTAAALGALFIDTNCADVPSSEVCWSALGFWILIGMSAGLVLGGLVLIAPDSPEAQTTTTLAAPLLHF